MAAALVAREFLQPGSAFEQGDCVKSLCVNTSTFSGETKYRAVKRDVSALYKNSVDMLKMEDAFI